MQTSPKFTADWVRRGKGRGRNEAAFEGIAEEIRKKDAREMISGLNRGSSSVKPFDDIGLRRNVSILGNHDV